MSDNNWTLLLFKNVHKTSKWPKIREKTAKIEKN